MKTKVCPKCGKLMREQRKFKGLWTCIDNIPVNDAPPFKYKCDGMMLTKAGARDFKREICRVAAERN